MADLSDEELVAYIDAQDGESFFDLVLETLLVEHGIDYGDIPISIIEECIPLFIEVVRSTRPERLPLDDAVEERCVEIATQRLLEMIRSA